MRDLLGDSTQPAQQFVQAPGGVFDTEVEALSVSPTLLEQYLIAAESLSIAATSKDNLARLLPCDPSGAAEASCIRRLVEQLGARAYRRPLQADEVDRLMATYTQGRSGADVATGVQWALQRMLMAPDFLYRVEIGSPLTPWETASRLSYFLRGTMPDEALFAAAAAGKLSRREEVAAQVRRLLREAGGSSAAQADAVVKAFFSQWLGLKALQSLSKDKTAYPEFDVTLAKAMSEETTRQTADVFWSGGGLAGALAGRTSFVNAKLAGVYGVADVMGDAFQKVALPAGQRAGVMTQASFLSLYAGAQQSDPIRRGAVVRGRFLCNPPPPPPKDVDTTPPKVDPKATTRERFAAHAAQPFCAACHRLIDPIGFAFENFDAIGRWRATSNGKPIDASGQVDDSDIAGPFVGAVELAERLARSAQARACVAQQWFRFAYGRTARAEDACTLAAAVRDFAAHDSFEELVLSLATSDSFTAARAAADAP